MNPCELNVLITALTNYFFANLTKEEFATLSVFLNELSKSMFASALFRDICERNQKKACERAGKNSEKAPEKASG